ncbi:rac GTPase-activating protein 1-like [Anneissia japonica]|uniref:rac GTPase-activating protein 1-like n=1 Tax=Anneissia japonica TaxID=1529436 RepID=UPI001425847B|nr:rac GTPase-activating protein 1-like [Anneissia japonica]
MTKHHKSILAVVDEIVSYSSVCSTSDESEFLKFARNQEDCRLKWLKSEEANRMLQERIFQLQAEKEALDVKLKHARNQIDIEMQRRRKAETGQEELDRQICLIRELLGDGKLNTLNDKERESLAFLNGTAYHQNGTPVRRLSAIDESGDLLSPSDISYDHTEDDLDSSCLRGGKKWRKDYPQTRKVEGYILSATAKRDTSVITTTTVTVPSSGPVTAATHIETIPSLQQNFQRPQPLQTRSKPTRDHMKLNQGHDESDDSFWGAPENQHLKAALYNSPAPKSPVLSPQSAPSQSPKKPQRPHTFVTKTVIKPESCNPCGKRIKFGKYALKCKDCRAVCHPDCKEMVALPCVPSASTPGKKLSNTLGDYVPTSSPLVPAIVVSNNISYLLACFGTIVIIPTYIYKCHWSQAVKDLKEKILRSKGNPQLEKVPDIHVVCGTLKDFLRHLDEPLVTYKLHKAFMNATEYSDNEDGITAIYQAISELPQANRDTLAYLILHLQRVTECPSCRMPSANLAKVFGPTIVGHSCADPEPMVMLNDTKKQPKVIHLLMSLPSDFWRAFINIDTENVHGGSNNIIANNNAGTPGENSVPSSMLGPVHTPGKSYHVQLLA